MRGLCRLALGKHAQDHPDAFADVVGAEAAVTAWRRSLPRAKASPSTLNQALASVTLLYENGAQMRIQVKRARVPRPGEPDALTPHQQGKVERAADRRGARGAAINRSPALRRSTSGRMRPARRRRRCDHRPHRRNPVARQR
ncbi:hypothetical protein [Saccharopolyspora hattusasensis]|uniref:hypothetical protein n=1 Tax=Saccharopolyspora hattusasensis TaxID=1128679 RepID=UPI003D971A5C